MLNTLRLALADIRTAREYYDIQTLAIWEAVVEFGVVIAYAIGK